MSQAEIASAVLSAEGSYPTKGTRFRDFTLWSDADRPVSLSDYRGRYNVVLLFLGAFEKGAPELLESLGRQREQIEDLESRILAVLTLPLSELGRVKRPPMRELVLLSDEDGSVHKAAGALTDDGMPAPADYLTDRYAEIFAVFRTREGHRFPEVNEILRWLEFIEAQCPECEAPEWPV